MDSTRACTAVSSQKSCWLVSNLDSWNEMLYAISYELVEYRPGKLSLRYLKEKPVDRRPMTSAQQAAYMISWLIERHACIEELRFLSSVLPDNPTLPGVGAPIRLRPPPEQSDLHNIRRLELRTCLPGSNGVTTCCYLPEEDLLTLCGLESIRVACADSKHEPGLVKVLHRNSDSLRIVDITQPMLSQDMVEALQCLSKSESVALSFCRQQGESGSGTDALTRLVQTLPSVKAFRFYSLTVQAWNVCGVADALRKNENLTTLELYMFRVSSSLKDLFAALEVNTSLKELRIAFRTVDASCGDALGSAISNNACLLYLGLSGQIADYCMARLAVALSQNATLEKLHFSGSSLGFNGILALCDTLRTNKTLKEVVLPHFPAGDSESNA
ncbi:hypothetical protein V5799_029024 [Amblyomma americanum]|uniref:Ran gtpase-activating protein n=1 Tax=Amblyomma americanum TaxID=6943 RepID=A0AAQ4ESC6_AMBAM